MASSSEPASNPAIVRWEPVSRETVADCRVFKVDRVWFRHPRRAVKHDFFVINSVDWVHVVARTSDDRLVLVRQFRFGSEEFSLEVPGGLIEPGEDPLVAAQRELLEETGYGGGTARVLAQVRPNPALQKNICHLVLVEDVRLVAGLAWDEHEEIETQVLPTADAISLARNGGMTHSLTLTALFLFEPFWRQDSQPGSV